MPATDTQLTLNFEAGLTARFRSLREVSAHTVYASRKGLASVAGDLDMSPSELTKRLNQDTAEPRPLRVDDLEEIIRSTGDFTPIYYLCEKYLQDDEARKKAALQQLQRLMPEFVALFDQAGMRRK